MVKVKNLLENENIQVVEQQGNIRILEYVKDLSVRPDNAVMAYYASEMNVHKRQVLIELKMMLIR